MLQARARSFALRDVFPDVLLGLSMSAEELGDIPLEEPAPRAPKVVEAPSAEQAVKASLQAVVPPSLPPEYPLYVLLPGGERKTFARSRKGLYAALEFIEAAGAPAVMNNLALLDLAVERQPDFADWVAEIRAKAAEALAPKTDAGDPPDDWAAVERIATAYDTETGEVVEPDRIAQKVAERRGAAPLDGMPEPGEFPG
jgi:hypothetical protein